MVNPGMSVGNIDLTPVYKQLDEFKIRYGFKHPGLVDNFRMTKHTLNRIINYLSMANVHVEFPATFMEILVLEDKYMPDYTIALCNGSDVLKIVNITSP